MWTTVSMCSFNRLPWTGERASVSCCCYPLYRPECFTLCVPTLVIVPDNWTAMLTIVLWTGNHQVWPAQRDVSHVHSPCSASHIPNVMMGCFMLWSFHCATLGLLCLKSPASPQSWQCLWHLHRAFFCRITLPLLVIRYMLLVTVLKILYKINVQLPI